MRNLDSPSFYDLTHILIHVMFRKLLPASEEEILAKNFFNTEYLEQLIKKLNSLHGHTTGEVEQSSTCVEAFETVQEIIDASNKS